MTIDPRFLELDPPIPAESNKANMSFEYEHHFDDFGQDASTRIFLGDSILAEIDSALKLFTPVLRTRKDFMYTATLWALECINTDPKIAMKKLAATGVVNQVAAQDHHDGSAS